MTVEAESHAFEKDLAASGLQPECAIALLYAPMQELQGALLCFSGTWRGAHGNPKGRRLGEVQALQ